MATDANSGSSVLTENFWRSQENMQIVPASWRRTAYWTGECPRAPPSVAWMLSGTCGRQTQILWQPATVCGSKRRLYRRYPCKRNVELLLPAAVVHTQQRFGQRIHLLRLELRLLRRDGDLPTASFPGGTSGDTNITELQSTPRTRKKPYLYMDSSGNYNVFSPGLQLSSGGPDWNAQQIGP